MDIKGDVVEEEKKRRFAAWDMKFIMIHVLCSPIIYLENDGDRLNSASGALLNYDTGLVVIWQ